MSPEALAALALWMATLVAMSLSLAVVTVTLSPTAGAEPFGVTTVLSSHLKFLSPAFALTVMVLAVASTAVTSPMVWSHLAVLFFAIPLSMPESVVAAAVPLSFGASAAGAVAAMAATDEAIMRPVRTQAVLRIALSF